MDNSQQSAFYWSPLPHRKQQLNFTMKTSEQTQQLIKPDVNDLYPNCDVNVWLRSCEKEIIEPILGTVTGTIPEWLNGSLYRNGPGSLKVGEMQFEHLFDSSALLHRFNINNGHVTYQCRFLKTKAYKENHMAGRIVVTEFGTSSVPDPCHTIFHRVASMFVPGESTSDNAMISIYPFGDQLYAFTESPIIHRFNPDTLETEERLNVAKHVNIVNHTSHPHVLPDGTVYNLAMSVSKWGPVHSIVRFPYHSDSLQMFETAEILTSVPVRWPLHPSYMHTFGMTEYYFLLVLQPLSVSLASMVKLHLLNQPFAGCLQWYQDEQTCIIVINRKTGDVDYRFYTEAFFFLHIINQYEIGDEYIIIDICCYRDPAMLDCMYVETMKNMQKMPDYAKMFRGRPLRFVLPLKPSSTELSNLNKLPNSSAKAFRTTNGDIYVTPELLCDLGCETPRIHYDRYLGKKYRYFYAISSDVDAENPGTIIKVDVENKTAKTWCETNCYPSEPIFVPRPGVGSDGEEDDGVIVASLVWGGDHENRAGLLVLDARTWTEIGRAEFNTPGPVPKCLHGWFSQR